MKTQPRIAILIISTVNLLGAQGLPSRAWAQEGGAPSDDAPEEKAAQEKVGEGILEIFQIEWAKADDLSELLSDLLRARAAQRGPGGKEASGAQTKIVTDARTNRLIIQTTLMEDLEAVRMLIKELDTPVHENRLKTIVYQVKHAKADKIARVLSDLIRMPVEPRSRPVRPTSRRGASTRTSPSEASERRGSSTLIIPHLETNSLLIQASPPVEKEILQLLEALDVKRLQVFLEAAIVMVNSTSDLNNAVVAFGRKPDEEKNDSDLQGGAAEFSEIANKGDFASLVQFFKNNKESQVVATPFVLADNNVRSQVDIVETRYVTTTSVQANQTTLSSQQGEPAGITLSMTPTISEAKKAVLIDLGLSISAFAQSDNKSTLPPKSEASAESSVTVLHGKIAVVGGLGRVEHRRADDETESNNIYLFLRAMVQDAP